MAGNAFCLKEDLDRASSLIGRCPIIAVNGAAREIEAFALFSYHPQRFIEPPYSWITRRKKLGGEFTVHSAFRDAIPDMPWVDHWWEGANGDGGSAWGARKLAALMGFSKVVLCGAPLIPGPYSGYQLPLLMGRQDVVDKLLSEIESDTEWHEGVYSMSGRTRDLFGEPC